MREFLEDDDERTPLYPKNRYVVLEEINEEGCGHDDEESSVLIPEEFLTKNIEPYKVYVLEETAPDCAQVSSDEIGRHVVVNNSMIEKIVLDGEEFVLLQENHIYGVLGE